MPDNNEVLLMLYDGAISFLSRAIEAFEAQNHEDTSRFIIRTQNIISELKGALKMEYEVAQSLYQLYDYFNRRLTEANEKQDRLPVYEVQGYLKELRGAWAEAMVKVGETAAPPDAVGVGV